jgi:excisionase family DNA binding protein
MPQSMRGSVIQGEAVLGWRVMRRPNGIETIANTCGKEAEPTLLLASQPFPNATNPDQILDLKSAAHLLGFSRSHLSKILARRFPDLPLLRHVRVGRTVRIRRSALLDWFREAEGGTKGSKSPQGMLNSGSSRSTPAAQQENLE